MICFFIGHHLVALGDKPVYRLTTDTTPGGYAWQLVCTRCTSMFFAVQGGADNND